MRNLLYIVLGGLGLYLAAKNIYLQEKNELFPNTNPTPDGYTICTAKEVMDFDISDTSFKF